jgi:mannosyltransferase OCH1-like enzyme
MDKQKAPAGGAEIADRLDTELGMENWGSCEAAPHLVFTLLSSLMNRRRAVYIFLSILALFLVGTVIVLSSITYYLAIDPDAYLSDLEVPILDNKTRWDPAEHNRTQYVPKIIHQTWKTEILPPRWQTLSQECRDMMPD